MKEQGKHRFQPFEKRQLEVEGGRSRYSELLNDTHSGKPHQTVLPEVEHLPQAEHVLPVASVWNIILYPPFVFKVASSVINTKHCPSSDEILAPLWAIVDIFFFLFWH